MTLERGVRLGPYEIVELRGKGGMGGVTLHDIGPRARLSIW